MEQSQKNNRVYTKIFVSTGLLFLVSTFFFGLLAGLQYIIPGFGRDVFSFEKLRPLHVSSAVFWILMAAMGGVLSYLQEETNKPIRSKTLLRLQYILFTGSFTAILISYCFGIFSGREYWEFHPFFTIPILVGWIVFLINFFGRFTTLKNQPVYVWMWLTGVVFFLFTYIESNLWLIPSIRNHLAHDMTIQWKSYGSMVGSWNMLVYGSSIYLMDKIAGNKKYSYSSIGYLLYALSLFNLMFNWGHHIYTLPTVPYVGHIAYIVSMTELLILGRIIYTWRKTLSAAQKHQNVKAYRFLFAADSWVFANLGLAIAMSIPALNVFMHGTHIIVAHTMGTTIGINTMLLLAFAYDLLDRRESKQKVTPTFIWAYRFTNIGLAVFLLALAVAGVLKSYWQFNQVDEVGYGTMMDSLRPYFIVFYIAGIAVVVGLLMLAIPLIKFSKKALAETE